VSTAWPALSVPAARTGLSLYAYSWPASGIVGLERLSLQLQLGRLRSEMAGLARHLSVADWPDCEVVIHSALGLQWVGTVNKGRVFGHQLCSHEVCFPA